MTDIEQFMDNFSFRKYNQALYMCHSLEVVRIQVCMRRTFILSFTKCILDLYCIVFETYKFTVGTLEYFLCIFTILAKFKQCCKIGQYQNNRKCTIFLEPALDVKLFKNYFLFPIIFQYNIIYTSSVKINLSFLGDH